MIIQNPSEVIAVKAEVKTAEEKHLEKADDNTKK
jgi:hypothetical protein